MNLLKSIFSIFNSKPLWQTNGKWASFLTLKSLWTHFYWWYIFFFFHNITSQFKLEQILINITHQIRFIACRRIPHWTLCHHHECFQVGHEGRVVACSREGGLLFVGAQTVVGEHTWRAVIWHVHIWRCATNDKWT